MDRLDDFIKAAGHVKPSPRQLKWFNYEMYGFVHFTVNTYTDKEWGDGTEDEKVFNPVNLDCEQWAREFKNAGCAGMILTAKHHDGFCLWQSKYTEHCVKNSPWKDGKGDVVREAAEACKKVGIKFGVYLSPWDRNSKYYGTDQYNDYYVNQLTELLTNYGELFAVWQDNACGEGPGGKKQVYDFERFNRKIRELQPDAFIFNDFGPDVRWCGNEGGTASHSQWAVVPTDLCYRSEKQLDGCKAIPESIKGVYNSDNALGSLSNILGAEGLCFTGSEFDFSIRPGWFYHEYEEPKTAEEIFERYINLVGGNGCINLNVPPRRDGTFDPKDIEVLHRFADLKKEAFGTEIPSSFSKIAGDDSGRAVYEIDLKEKKTVKYIEIMENIAEGQRVENFEIRTGAGNACFGSTIGHKKICRTEIKDQDKIFLVITSSRDIPDISSIRLF